ncbi:MAG TPA: peptidylprolyl isomerase [Candidatus Binatia bacterium]|nr:peptidylprolyl isomerase [Candidatus Binatia bacterium]
MDLADLVPPGIVKRRGSLRQRPLLHFLALGAVLFAVQAALAPRVQTLELDDADLEQLRRQWSGEQGRAPGAAELAAAQARRADEERLLAEARRLGLDRHDLIVRRRLLQNLRFALGTDAGASDETLLERARRLGMDRRDPVVRGRLLQLMRQRAAADARLGPTDISDYVERHADRYAAPARSAVEQRFFSRDRHGARTHADAISALKRLQDGTGVTGDPFLLGDTLPPSSPAELARAFGEPAAQAIARAAPGRWIGPVASAWGEHLFRVTAQLPAAPADAATVRRQAAYAALAEREQQAVDALLAALRSRYRVEWRGEAS